MFLLRGVVCQPILAGQLGAVEQQNVVPLRLHANADIQSHVGVLCVMDRLRAVAEYMLLLHSSVKHRIAPLSGGRIPSCTLLRDP